MKYIPQLTYILIVTFLGELLHKLIPLPVPAAIYGILLLLICLFTGILKEEKVADAADLLISSFPILFVAPIAKLLLYWGLISHKIFAICVIMVISSIIVFAVSGLVTKWCQKKKEDRDNG